MALKGISERGEIQDETQQTLAFRDETKSIGSTKEAKKEYPRLASNQEIVQPRMEIEFVSRKRGWSTC